jgi:hypothetical protein
MTTTLVVSEARNFNRRNKAQRHAPWLLGLGVILAFVPMLVCAMGPYWGITFHVTVFQLGILGVAGLGALWLSLHGRVVYLSTVAFPILFLIGYPLRIISIETNTSLDPLVDVSLFIGRFTFTKEAYWEFIKVALVGLFGLTLGQVVVLAFFCRKSSVGTKSAVLVSNKLTTTIWWWFGLSIGVLLLSKVLGVGTNGLEPAALPFRIAGLLFFCRTLALPLVGMYLFGVAVENNMRRKTYAILKMTVIIGVASFPVTLSKAALLYSMLPYLAYLFIYSYQSRLSKKMVHWGAVAVILLLPVMVLSVQAARDLAYSQGKLANAQEIIDEVSTSFGSASVSETTIAMRNLVLDRILGASELMGVVAGRPYSRRLIFEVLRGNGTNEDVGVSDVFYDLFGLMPATVNGVYNGKAFGLFGLLYLSHESILVFCLALFLGGLVLWIEDLFLRRMNAGASALVGFMICMAVWEGGFDTLRLYPPILGGGLLVCWILSGYRKRRTFLVKSIGWRVHRSDRGCDG